MKHTKNDKGVQVRRRIKAFYFGLRHFGYHFLKSVRFGCFDYYANQKSFIAMLTSNYHVVEKSLAMPNFEYGHCRDRVLNVCGDVIKYAELGFDCGNVQFQGAVQAVMEYKRVHDDAHIELDDELTDALDKVSGMFAVPEHDQPYSTPQKFFELSDSPFPVFAESRHSVRSYSSEPVPMTLVEDSVDIARTTPTPCNRQPNKTYVVKDHALIKSIIKVQGGGRGFAEDADKLLIVTSDISVFNFREQFEAFKSGGMYTMNLLYALHYNKIGACPLEWGECPKNDRWLRRLLSIPENESVISIISIGYPKPEFRYVTSSRSPLCDSLFVVD